MNDYEKRIIELEHDIEFYRKLWRRERRNNLSEAKIINRRWLTGVVLTTFLIGTVLCIKQYLADRQPLSAYCPDGYITSVQYVGISDGDTLYRIMGNVRMDNPVMMCVPKPAWKQAIMEQNDMLESVEADCIQAGEYLAVPIFVQVPDVPEYDE